VVIPTTLASTRLSVEFQHRRDTMRKSTLFSAVTLLLVACSGILSTNANAQVTQKDLQELEERLSKVYQKKIEDLKTEQDTKIADLKTENENRLAEIEKNHKEIADFKTENENRLAEIEKKYKEIADLKTENANRLAEIEQLSTKYADGRRYPNILANMGISGKYDDEVRRVLQGELVIKNQTGTSQTFFVNGARWRIPKGQHSLWVLYGKLTVHLASERPKDLSSYWKLVPDEKGNKPNRLEAIFKDGKVHFELAPNNENSKPKHHQIVVTIGWPKEVPRGF